jgi:hypothetical protein
MMSLALDFLKMKQSAHVPAARCSNRRMQSIAKRRHEGLGHGRVA